VLFGIRQLGMTADRVCTIDKNKCIRNVVGALREFKPGGKKVRVIIGTRVRSIHSLIIWRLG
jgi:hypothetical protein